jgi:hypothetical protein
MSEDAPEPQPYPWLPIARVLAWLRISDGDARQDAIEECRRGACCWIEDQRKDLWIEVPVEDSDPVETVLVFQATDRHVSAGLLATARLFARMDSPSGVVAFETLGAGSVLQNDPDVRRLIGRPKAVFG